MKTKVIAIILVLLGLVVVGVVFLGGKRGQEEVESIATSTPSSPSSITTLEQNVFLKGVDKKEEQVTTSATTSAGAIIRTSSTGRALIESPKSHPTLLDYSSELTIVSSEDEGNKTVLELFGGALWSRAKKSAEKGEYYEIKTGNGVAVVRGTSFGLSYLDGVTKLVVAEGKVSLYLRDPETGELIFESEKIVGADHGAIIGKDGEIKVNPLSDEEKKSEWFMLNTDTGTDTNTKSDTSQSTVPTTTTTDTKPTRPTSPPANTTTTTPAPTTVKSDTTTAVPTSNSSKAVVGSVTPAEILYGDNKTYVVLRGSGFKSVAFVSVYEQVPPDLEIVDDTAIRFHIGKLLPGTYDIYLVMNNNSNIKIPQTLTIKRQ